MSREPFMVVKEAIDVYEPSVNSTRLTEAILKALQIEFMPLVHRSEFSPLSIRMWQAEIHANAIRHGWWPPGDRAIPSRLMLVVTEAAEAMEEFRMGLIAGEKNNYLRLTPDERGVMKPEGFAIEIADIVIRCLDLAEGTDQINVETMMKLKHEYNLTRPYRHGNKQA